MRGESLGRIFFAKVLNRPAASRIVYLGGRLMRSAHIHRPQNRGRSKLCCEAQPRPVVDGRVDAQAVRSARHSE